MLEVFGSAVFTFAAFTAAGALWWHYRRLHDGVGFGCAVMASVVGIFLLWATIVSAMASPNGKALAVLPLGTHQVVCAARDGDALLVVEPNPVVTEKGKIVPRFYAVPAAHFVAKPACRGETLTLAVADKGGENRVIRVVE